MAIIGLDDTDSRELGMCTTYVATELADRIESAGGSVERVLLVRLNPAVEHKTRGNAALAIHANVEYGLAVDLVDELLALAATADERTNPGAVIARSAPEHVPEGVAAFATHAVRDFHTLPDARKLIEEQGYEYVSRGSGRGLIGALAAVGAWAAFEEWTYECLSYREPDRWGTDRDVDYQSVIEAANEAHPTVWDTVDREEGFAVCVPRTPCPVLYGIRGDEREAVERVARSIESEPVERRQVFVTNQGTDAHIQPGTLGTLADGRSYRVTGEVVESPATHPGGHVFLTIAHEGNSLDVAAFEPTKRFRDRVRNLRVGDQITVCGEVTDGTLKLEKFAVRELVRTKSVTPPCPDCERKMKSAGRTAGYRCRSCGTTAEGRIEKRVERDLERGWYEVPPVARRHLAKPLVRGGFDGPTHPER